VKGENGFKREVMEAFGAPSSLEKAIERGYKDFKYCYYGNKDSLPLSIKLDVVKEGKVLLCQPPGVWGHMPSGFKEFWTCGTNLLLTKNVNDLKSWEFDREKAIQIEYYPLNEKMPLCVQTSQDVPAGNHVLTIEATSISKIMISFILIP
jgi:hypothetical protein